ncbi:hypothetical protein LIER_07885 [Lithospermum erythrorhizon]|uniref:MULE transposase domain-containing protein n=1 Tax=Lithospermum erythrorhizon TaxID=34254 RepID=A0AAV3PBJ4_LITER
MNFTVTFALLENEKGDNYTLVLNHVCNLFQENSLPNVIYTDRDYAFIKAVEAVFLESKHHLCRRHNKVNVRKRALELSSNKEFSEIYMRKWNYAISALDVVWMYRWSNIEEEYK